MVAKITEIIIDIPKKEKDTGCVWCDFYGQCQIHDPNVCAFRNRLKKCEHDPKQITDCIDCIDRQKSITNTIVSGRGC